VGCKNGGGSVEWGTRQKLLVHDSHMEMACLLRPYTSKGSKHMASWVVRLRNANTELGSACGN